MSLEPNIIYNVQKCSNTSNWKKEKNCSCRTVVLYKMTK